MNNTAWQRARREVELGDLHVHDLRHTTGMRLTSEINATWSHVKLSSQRREKLRTAVRRHPSVTQHLLSRSKVGGLRKADLLDLAAKLGIDYAAVPSSPVDQHPEIGSAEAVAGALVSDAFAGCITFDLDIQFLGRKIGRKARIHYTHTPDWVYLHRESGKEVIPFGEGGTYSLEVQSVSESEITNTGQQAAERGRTIRKHLKTAWEPCNDLTKVGIWSDEMWDAIRDQIDCDCRAQDAANRQHAQHDVPGARAA